MLLLHDWLPEAELCYLVVSAYIPNCIVSFAIFIEFVRWIYRIVYELFWVTYPTLKS
jgi:hypothetical protein